MANYAGKIIGQFLLMAKAAKKGRILATPYVITQKRDMDNVRKVQLINGIVSATNTFKSHRAIILQSGLETSRCDEVSVMRINEIKYPFFMPERG